LFLCLIWMGVLSDIYWYGRIVKEEMGVWRERARRVQGPSAPEG